MKFLYENAAGERNEWELINAVDDGIYISGVAIPKLGYKTFRKERVIKYFSDEYAITPKLADRSITSKEKRLEVAFTGFAKADRAELERLASEEHNMLVRKDVTRLLDFLVTGYNAGPKKLIKAEEQDVLVLQEDAFRHMLATGELPE